MADRKDKLSAGVDGGGTRTRAAVFRGETELGRGRAGAANPLTAGIDGACRSIRAALEVALQASGLGMQELHAIGLGIAGVGASAAARSRLLHALRASIDESVALWTDVAAALAGAFKGDPGVLVIAGTGSIAIGFDGRRTARAGGWGRRIEDRGSGFEIFRQAAVVALEERDGLRSPQGSLVSRLLDAIGLGSASEIVSMFAGGPRPETVAQGVEAVWDAARDGDSTATALLAQAGRDLGQLVQAVVSRLQLREVWPLVVTGGVAGGEGPVRTSLVQSLPVPTFALVDARASPEFGAAALALERAAPGGRLAALLAALERDVR